MFSSEIKKVEKSRFRNTKKMHVWRKLRVFKKCRERGTHRKFEGPEKKTTHGQIGCTGKRRNRRRERLLHLGAQTDTQKRCAEPSLVIPCHVHFPQAKALASPAVIRLQRTNLFISLLDVSSPPHT